MTNGELAAEVATSESGDPPFDDGPPEGPPADEPDPHSGFSPTDVRNAIESATSEAEATDAAKRGNPAWKGTDIGDMLRAAYDDKIAHLRKIAAAAPKTSSAAKPPDRRTSAQIAGEFDRRLTAAKTELSVTAIWEEVKASTIDTATKELLADSRNQRLEVIRSDAAAPRSPEEKAKAEARAKEVAAMLARFFADCEESLGSGHPAKAHAAKINSKRSANSGEISQADAARIGARADEVIATCGNDSKAKGKAK